MIKLLYFMGSQLEDQLYSDSASLVLKAAQLGGCIHEIPFNYSKG